MEVEEGVSFYERNTAKLYVRELKPSQLIFAEGFAARPNTRRLKRIMDVAVATIGLVLAAPLMLLTAIAIKLESPGPLAITTGPASARRRIAVWTGRDFSKRMAPSYAKACPTARVRPDIRS